MRPLARRAMAFSLLALGACGNAPDGGTPAIFTDAVRSFGGLALHRQLPAVPPESAAEAGVTPEEVAGFQGPVLYAQAASRRANTLVPMTARVGRYTTWTAGDGISMTFKDGVLVATRGFGTDLMSADVDEVLDRLAGGEGTAVRVVHWLNGENHLVLRSFVCSYSHVGRESFRGVFGTESLDRIDEHCVTSDLSFDNSYWFRPGSHIPRRSRQWVGPELGPLVFETLK